MSILKALCSGVLVKSSSACFLPWLEPPSYLVSISNGLIDFSSSSLPFIQHIQISILKFVFEDRMLLFSVCLGLNLIGIYDFGESVLMGFLQVGC